MWGEVDTISRKFVLCGHVRNSLNHSVLQNIDITRRNFMLITLRTAHLTATGLGLEASLSSFDLMSRVSTSPS